MKKPLVSIIVRTRNEYFWIGKCLSEIYNQNYKNFEVILVDNKSTDNTVKIVKKNFPTVKIIKCNSRIFFPGRSLNIGIKASKGSLVAMISGHCIPGNKNWISNLVKNFKNKKVAGVYGRQEPLDISEPSDVRDLTYLFGLDKKIQTKDPFFHNANSMIRKNIWNKNKFDERTLHIEDRIWASKVLNKKYKIIYDPSARVLHFHGVSHHDNFQRVNTISKILKKKVKKFKRKIVCLIPVKNPIKINGEYILKKILNHLVRLKDLEKIFITSNDAQLKMIANNKKIKFLKRDEDLSKDFLGLEYVLAKTYRRYIKDIYKPSHILVVEEIYLNRPKNFFNNLINSINDEYDSIIPIVQNKSHNIWKKNNNGIMEPFFKTSLPSDLVNYKIYEEAKGLGCIVKSDIFETNGRETNSRKFIEVDNQYSFTINKKSKNLNIFFDAK